MVKKFTLNIIIMCSFVLMLSIMGVILYIDTIKEDNIRNAVDNDLMNMTVSMNNYNMTNYSEIKLSKDNRLYIENNEKLYIKDNSVYRRTDNGDYIVSYRDSGISLSNEILIISMLCDVYKVDRDNIFCDNSWVPKPYYAGYINNKEKDEQKIYVYQQTDMNNYLFIEISVPKIYKSLTELRQLVNNVACDVYKD